MKCVDKFFEIYGKDPADVSFCPYRICPIGAHSDHQLGKIIELVDQGIHMAYWSSESWLPSQYPFA